MYKPIFFKLNIPEDKEKYNVLLNNYPTVQVYNEIEGQLKELIKIKNPTKRIKPEEFPILIENHLSGKNIFEYGVWVYYPWSNRLVHILPEEEFIELRTSANRNKITSEEQRILSTKKVGIIGLSVGQSVAVTMALERTCGELRLADFDTLELNNLNRIRTGVHNLGLLKAYSVAREIAEIDPFINIICFSDGITEENINDFMTYEGKLDVVIDECDGVDIKLKCRIAAKKYQIPVLMEASDRGTVDIERFDLEPLRPLLHGFIQHLNISEFHTLTTNEQKLPYLLAFAGVETLSTRMKASAIEVGQTITTWPQLASAVTMGGGITTDVCRRILLDQFHLSGRYFIDIEELIGDPKEEINVFQNNIEKLTVEKMKNLASVLPYQETKNTVLNKKIIEILVQAALLAPSPGNNQPWKWYFDGRQLLLFTNQERAASYGDFKYMATYMSFGTAIENIKLKATELKLKVDIEYFPLKNEGNYIPVAILRFSNDITVVKDDLVDFLNIRYTNRRKGDNTVISEYILNDLKRSISEIKDTNLILISDNERLQKIANITGKAEKLRMFIPQGHYEFFEKEIRWTPESVESTRDGLDIRTLDLDAKDAIGLRVAKDIRAINLLHDWNKGNALENITKNLVSTASSIGLITGANFTPENCLFAGNAVQRIWLTASKNNISMQPVLATVLHFARLIQGRGVDMPKDIQIQFKELHQEFISIFNFNSDEVPLFLFRLFNATEPMIKSLRLNLDEIYFS